MSDQITLRNINEMKRLMANVRGDITTTGQRAKDMQDFVTKIGVYTNVNPLTSTKHLDQTNKVVSGITEAFDHGFKGQGIGGHRAVYREISHKYTMGYVTRMGDDMKDQLRDILGKNLDKGLGWQETAKDMVENVDGMTRKRAVMIARTESVRAKNLGQWAEHKEMGYKYFEVLPHSTACKRCKKEYIGVVFPMTGKFAVMLPPLHPNCFDKETEVYTDNGWKLFKDVEETDKILSLNPETHEIEFVRFIDKIKYHYKGNLIHFYNKWFDMMVTPDHQMFVGTRPYKDDRKRYYWNFRDAEKVNNSCSIPRVGEWYPKLEKNKFRFGDLEFNPEGFVFFMGWWLSEGSTIPEDDIRHGNRITIHQIKQPHLDNIHQKLQNEIGHSVNISKLKDKIQFHHEKLRKYLLQFGKQHVRHVPQEIKDLPSKYIQIFLEAYLAGDGHTRETLWVKKDLKSSERVFTTSSKKMADDLSELILKCGGYPSISFEKRKGRVQKFRNGEYEIKTNIYYIRWNTSKTAKIRNMKRKLIPYDDMVYCLTLEKNHVLWVKRKDKTAFSGNCRCASRYYKEVPAGYKVVRQVPTEFMPSRAMVDFSKFKTLGPGLEDHIQKSTTWRNSLIDLNKKWLGSLEQYQDQLYKDINFYLREGRLWGSSILGDKSESEFIAMLETHISRLDKLIRRSRTDTDLRLYRGIPESGHLKVGDIIPDDAFMSTSTSFDEAKKYARSSKTILEILYEKNNKGLPVTSALEMNGKLSLHSEYELILPRKFRGRVIGKYNRDGYNIIQVQPL